MARIDAEQVAKIAWLARMAVPDDDVDRYATELSKILDLADVLSQAPVDGIPPLAHPLEDLPAEAPAPLRDDAVTETAPVTDCPAPGPNARADSGLYLVPPVIEPSP